MYSSYLDDLTETGRIKGANTEETTNAAHSMIAKGLGAKVEIKKWSVFGSTRHKHTMSQCGLGHAQMRLQKISMWMCMQTLNFFTEHCRETRTYNSRSYSRSSKKIVDSESYIGVNENLTVYQFDGSVETVSCKGTKFWTCIANSHGEVCVCILFPNILYPTSSENISDDSHCFRSSERKPVTLQAMLTDLHEWSKSEHFCEDNEVYRLVISV
ncbi:uncharacterized protein LOC125245738 [Megalobrama amblycephala]|uniref:uncharacterized protein LOC125245738 n=1 Tax=Megalobrama amblycephala TaxID=75352 RepID=UPI0020143287|nr:uncharacterized protein LOC125245738 [Megalobrama amblycephala]